MIRRKSVCTALVGLFPIMLALGCMDPDRTTAPAEDTQLAKGSGAGPMPVVNWSELPPATDVILESVWGSNARNVYAVGRDGTVVRYDGSRWSAVEVGTSQSLYDIWGSGPDDIWVVGGLGTAVRFDGNQWIVDELRDAGNGRRLLYAVWGSGPNDVWAAGNGGHAWRFDGTGWNYSKLPTDQPIRGLWGSGPSDVFAVGDGGTILHFDGSAWSVMQSGTSARLNAVWGRSGNNVFAAGSFGEIRRFDGTSWREDPQSRSVSPHHIRTLWGNAAHDVFAVAWGGTILHHDGATWKRMNTGTGVHLEGIWGSPGTELHAVGYYGTALKGARGLAGKAPPIQHPRRPAPPEAIWPISGTAALDADSVHAPFGPRRLPLRYDFHAGIDIPAPTGTPVKAVMAGTVTQITRSTAASGPGNAVTVVHSGNRATSYLHLHEIHVAEGDRLEQGQVLGTVGQTGATYPHLHLGYFVDLPGSTRDERYSRNPLELLPHGVPEPIHSTFVGNTVNLDVLVGAGDERLVDYYAVVARGATPRDEQIQFGIHLDAGRPSGGRFSLDLTPAPADFAPQQVIVTGIFGDTLLHVRRSDGQ